MRERQPTPDSAQQLIRVGPDESGSVPGRGRPGVEPADPTRRKIRALVDLLADDSPRVLATVRSELAALGRRALPALRAAARSGEPGLRARARALLLERERKLAVRRLVRYATHREHDLETGLFLLDAYSFPGEDHRPHQRALQAMADELGGRIRKHAPGVERALCLPRYLGGELGYEGDREDTHHPDRIALSRTIERKTGLPLTLGAIYVTVASRAGMEASLLPFPGHVLVSVKADGERVILDPFGGGKVLSEIHCLSYLADHGFPYQAEWFRAASPTAMIARQVRNLVASLRERRRFGEVPALVSLQGVLERHPNIAGGARSTGKHT